MDKTTAGQKSSGGLQDVELKRRVGGIYGGGGGGGGREKEREGKEDDDRLKHFGSISIGRISGANLPFIFEDGGHQQLFFSFLHSHLMPIPAQSILFFITKH